MKMFVVLILTLGYFGAHAHSNHPTPIPSPVIRTIIEAAISQNVPPLILISICSVESSLNPYTTNFNDGHGNSHGLCQIQTRTARWMGFKGEISHLYNTKINVKYAAKYLRYQLTRYDNNIVKAISAYNAGRYIKNNSQYVNKVLNNVYTQGMKYGSCNN